MIKSGIRPVGGVVTSGTLGDGEARSDVIGNIAAQSLCAVPLRKVAGRIAAVRWLNGEGVIVVGMAVGAGGGDVRSG